MLSEKLSPETLDSLLGIDLSGLESLYRLNALEHSMHERVGNFLVARGIVGITENALRTAAKRLS
jgi:hypothetical protein